MAALEMTPQERIDDLKGELEWLYARIDAISARIRTIMDRPGAFVHDESISRMADWRQQRNPLSVRATTLRRQIGNLERRSIGGSLLRSRGKKTRRRR
jgi:hypothetical protein